MEATDAEPGGRDTLIPDWKPQSNSYLCRNYLILTAFVFIILVHDYVVNNIHILTADPSFTDVFKCALMMCLCVFTMMSGVWAIIWGSALRLIKVALAVVLLSSLADLVWPETPNTVARDLAIDQPWDLNYGLKVVSCCLFTLLVFWLAIRYTTAPMRPAQPRKDQESTRVRQPTDSQNSGTAQPRGSQNSETERPTGSQDAEIVHLGGENQGPRLIYCTIPADEARMMFPSTDPSNGNNQYQSQVTAQSMKGKQGSSISDPRLSTKPTQHNRAKTTGPPDRRNTIPHEATRVSDQANLMPQQATTLLD